VATNALADERKRIENLSDAGGTKHKDRVLGDIEKIGTVFIKK